MKINGVCVNKTIKIVFIISIFALCSVYQSAFSMASYFTRFKKRPKKSFRARSTQFGRKQVQKEMRTPDDKKKSYRLYNSAITSRINFILREKIKKSNNGQYQEFKRFLWNQLFIAGRRATKKTYEQEKKKRLNPLSKNLQKKTFMLERL